MNNDTSSGNNSTGDSPEDKKSTEDEMKASSSAPSHKDESQPEAVANPSQASTSESKAPIKKNSPSSEKPVTQKKSLAKKKSPGGRPVLRSLMVLFLLLAISGLGVAGWWFYQFQHQLQQKAPLVQENLASQQADIQRLEEQLAEERRERQNQQAALSRTASELQLNINSHARRLRELSTTSRTDWLLAEAEYLIRLANQRLITERNTKNAIALLITADEILRDLDEVDLLAVRGALAKSITALRMAPSVDREGLYLQLNALSEQLVQLPLIAPELLEGDRVTVEADSVIDDSWRGQLLRSFYQAVEGVSELIRVRRRNAPLEPLLSPEEDQFLRHNLGMMLEQAQLALLREEQAVYQASLAKAKKWLGDYFELNEGASQLVEQLSQLEQQKVVQQLPDISGGLEALRDYIDIRHRRHTVDGMEESSGEQQ
ncbi:MAG: uroporphyrinogen-III C-methyltransferase [Porticoccus sp.]|nr:uroporphyrinogen-III C-methyltransferase [Porticoccus sp.]MBQ0808494.1 uroporphyrinogen-III C-methyltransferase [Porticoccus sp.]